MPKVKLGEVAREYKSAVKNAADLPNVGLEHLIPGEIELTQWSEDSDNTFTKGFKKGQMLFGRRRAYLKKAAVAPFDGICSGDITVIEAIPEKILTELLPFVIQNDRLFDYAVEKSAGSLSPRVKWEHLNNYEFELPEIGQQKELVDLLWAMTRAKKAYQNLVKQTDELVKSQFIEMFGDPLKNSKGYQLQKYGDVFDLNAGGTPSKNHSEYWDNGTISWIGSNMCQDKVIYENDGQYITREGFEHSSARMFKPDTVLVALVGATIGKTALLKFETTTNQNVLGIRNIRESGYTPEFVFYYTQMIHDLFLEKGDGFKMASKGMISGFPIPIVELKAQEHFSSFVEQSDKSVFSEEKQI